MKDFSIRSLKIIELKIREIINRNDRFNTGDPSQIYLDTADLIQLLNVNARILKYWRKKGWIPYVRIRGRPRYRLSDIMKMLDDCRNAN